MKKNDPKWLKRFDGMMAWTGKAFEQWERAKTRRQESRKRNQAQKSK